MKKISIAVCLLTIFAACNKTATEKNPTPAALQKIIDDNSTCICNPFINQYQWKGQAVYVLAYKGAACNWVPGYFNTNGEPITALAGYSLNDFLQESSFSEAVWACALGD